MQADRIAADVRKSLTRAPLKESPQRKSERWRKCLPLVVEKLQEADIDNALPLFPELAAKILTGEVNEGKGVILLGATGNGKTRRMRFLSHFLGIRMIDAWEVVERIRHNDTLAYFREVSRVDISHGEDVPARYYDLIIDDLGFEDEKSVTYGNSRDIMERVLLARYQVFPRHKTYFASNLTPEQLKARYGDRIWSRLNEMCHFIAMPGGDRRMPDAMAGY